MKSLGIVRKVDFLGRIVIPKELRDTYDLSEGTPMEILVDGNMIILREYVAGCIFCGSIDFDTDAFKGKDICSKCREELRRGGK